jgi:hypothetical protein
MAAMTVLVILARHEILSSSLGCQRVETDPTATLAAMLPFARSEFLRRRRRAIDRSRRTSRTQRYGHSDANRDVVLLVFGFSACYGLGITLGWAPAACGSGFR